MPPALVMFTERDPPLNPKDVRTRLPRLLMVVLSSRAKRTPIRTPSDPYTVIGPGIRMARPMERGQVAGISNPRLQG
jgi:hypothetical protein